MCFIVLILGSSVCLTCKYRLPVYFPFEDQFPSAVDTSWQWRHPQAYFDVPLVSTFLWTLLSHFVGIKSRDLCCRIAAVRWNFTSCVISLCYCSCMLTNQPTPCRRVLPEKLIGPQPVKKFPTLCGNKRLITALTSAGHLSLPWDRKILHAFPFHFFKMHFIIFLHLRLDKKCKESSKVRRMDKYFKVT